jgi:CRISPR type III-B/RAMP module-associated protein Cmr5
MQNLEQIRAKNAYNYVDNYNNNGKFAEFKTYAQKLPMMLRTNGLLATWAFLMVKKDKGKDTLRALNDHLRGQFNNHIVATNYRDTFKNWVGYSEVQQENNLYLNNPNNPNLTQDLLREITEEAIEYSGWLKRAAESRGE